MGRRERYRFEGPAGFGDVELLALVLGVGTARRSVLQIAADLLEAFGDLRGLARCEPHELVVVEGIGWERAVRLHAALELGRRAGHLIIEEHISVRGPHDAWKVLEPGLRALPHEELHGLFLDQRRRVLARRTLSRGSPRYTVVDPRQIFRVAVGVGASAIIVAHNHPSGDPRPSEQDHQVTAQLAQAGEVLGIPLLDHLVIGAADYGSMAEHGAYVSGWSLNWATLQASQR